MGFNEAFSKFTKTVANTAKELGDQGKKTVKTTKLKFDISGLESEINKTMTEIGKEVVEKNISIDNEVIAKAIQKIEGLKAEIEAKKEEIKKIESEEKAAGEGANNSSEDKDYSNYTELKM